MSLTAEARSIIIGSLLGDAYLTPNGSLQVEQSFNQKEYLFWKYEKLNCIAGKSPVVVERYDKRTDKTYRSVRFYTKTVLKEFRACFYEDGKKIVPGNIASLLDPLALAVWFMDDGGRGARTPKGLVINTSSFSQSEQLILQAGLLEQFGVITSVHQVGRGFQLYIRAESFERFCELVSPYLIAQMRYKLPIDPVTTSFR